MGVMRAELQWVLKSGLDLYSMSCGRSRVLGRLYQSCDSYQRFSKHSPQAAASAASHGTLLEMQIFRPHPGPAK